MGEDWTPNSERCHMTAEEIIKRHDSADVELRRVGSVFQVWCAGMKVIETRVLTLAVIEYDEALARALPQRAKLLAQLRAEVAYGSMRRDNEARRASGAARGGKGGRGGV